MKKMLLMLIVLSSTLFSMGMTPILPMDKAWNEYHMKENQRLEDYMRSFEKEHRNGISSVSAMQSIPFQDIDEGEYSIGLGVGSFKESFSVGVGVLAEPKKDFNVKVVTGLNTDDIFDSSISIGVSYKISNK